MIRRMEIKKPVTDGLSWNIILYTPNVRKTNLKIVGIYLIKKTKTMCHH